MQIGSGWTTKDNDGKVTGISFALDGEVTEIFPQLKRVKIAAKPIPREQRKSEKSPGWRLTFYKPTETTTRETQNSSVTDEEYPF